MKKVGRWGILLLTVVLLLSCSKKPEDKIIGYWESIDDNGYVIAFFKGNTVMVNPVAGKKEDVYNYKFIGDNTIKIEALKPVIIDVSFTKDGLLKMNFTGHNVSFLLKKVDKREFEKASKRAAKRMLAATVEANLKNCLLEAELDYINKGEYSPKECNIKDVGLVKIMGQDGEFYFENEKGELVTENVFSNEVVSVKCVIKNANIKCK